MSAVSEYLYNGSMVNLHILVFQCGGLTLEYDVDRRQILTYKVGPRTQRVNIYIIMLRKTWIAH